MNSSSFIGMHNSSPHNTLDRHLLSIFSARRYIATTSLVNPKGSELIDASIAFEALMKAKLKDR